MNKLNFNINDNENYQLIFSAPYFIDYKEEVWYAEDFKELIGQTLEIQAIRVSSSPNIEDELFYIVIPAIPSELESLKEYLCNSYVYYVVSNYDVDLDIANTYVSYPQNIIKIKVVEKDGMIEVIVIEE